MVAMSSHRTETLGRRDRLLRKQVPRQLLRVIPIVLNPLPPPLGWLVIIYAYRNPRTMLTPQFWSPELKTRFIYEDADTKRAHFARLLEMVGYDSSYDCAAIDATASGSITTPAATDDARSSLRALREAVQSICSAPEAGFAAGPAAGPLADPAAQRRALASAVVPFESEGTLGLDVLPKQNLVALAAASMPRMNVQAIEKMPEFGLVRRLERIADELREDDGLLKDEGLDDLSEDEMRDAAVARGLVDSHDGATRQFGEGNHGNSERETMPSVGQKKPSDSHAGLLLFAPHLSPLAHPRRAEPPVLKSKLAAWIAILDAFEEAYAEVGVKARGLPAALILYFPAVLITMRHGAGASGGLALGGQVSALADDRGEHQSDDDVGHAA